MKLNLDCVRDVLFTVENLSTLNDKYRFEDIPISDISAQLHDYDVKEIIYTVLKLHEAGYITFTSLTSDISNAGYIPELNLVSDITYARHEYLNSVRDNKVWSNVKKCLALVSSASLPVVQQLAQDNIMKLIHP